MESWKIAQSIVGTSEGRPENDFYPTPPSITQALLDVEKLSSCVWECACGEGDMSRVLLDNGYKVHSTDLIDRGYGIGERDFLQEDVILAPSIVTNPPFKLAIQFMEHALYDLGADKLALFAKLSFLEGQRRTAKLMVSPLKNVHVFRSRQTLTRRGEKSRNGGMIAFAWYVWEHGYEGKPQIFWI